MDKYLIIMVTVLVATQVIRITQNTIQLYRQNKVIKRQLKDVEDVTSLDIQRQRLMQEYVITYLKKALDKCEADINEWIKEDDNV